MTIVPRADTVVLSVVVAAALSGRIRMVSLIARVSCWLTKRAETLSDPLLTVSRDDDHVVLWRR